MAEFSRVAVVMNSDNESRNNSVWLSFLSLLTNPVKVKKMIQRKQPVGKEASNLMMTRRWTYN